MATHQSEMTEQSMSEAEKLTLLNSAFDHVGDDHEHHHHHPPPRKQDRRNNKDDHDDGEVEEGEEDEMLFSSEKLNQDDYAAMFGEDDDDDGSSSSSDGGGSSGQSDSSSDDEEEDEGLKPPRKKQRTGFETSVATGKQKNDSDSIDGKSARETKNGGSNTDGKNNNIQEKKPRVILSQKQQEQLDLAKNKLSKWAARLFDPNRKSLGLVEAPQIIPLNDEFLTAFGKREKEYDEISGRVVDIEKTSLDVEALEDAGGSSDLEGNEKQHKKIDFSKISKGKVKLANLAYATTTATIARTCGKYGAVVDVNLILDDNGQSTGRAYVIFEDDESAAECVNKMNEQTLEGRVIRVSISSSSSSGRKSLDASGGSGGGSMRRNDTRYWDRDISTKCHQCGEVGHIAINCPNEERLRACNLCAQLGHDMWSCPMKCVCFNCGVPGHQSRDCPHRRRLPNRVVCTVCFQNGHHRFDCRERPWNSPSKEALCMQCGQKGHTMCSEMRWFFGLRGVTCFNCGGNHLGETCRRANAEVCAKNADVARQEIEMAGSMALSDQLSNQRSNREGRDSREGSRNGNGRAKSLPPSRQQRR